MFRYWKAEGKSVWRLIENSDKAMKAAIQQGAHFFTVLSVDQDIDNIDSDTKVHYKGPLYFDIDAADESESLHDVRKLLLSLYKDYGIDLKDLTIHCTGSKGFHVLVPAKVFSTGKSHFNLAYTYKNVALAFELQHLDWSIYSGGKGRMWRIENVRRENGRYKTRLTAAQVFGHTFEEILEITRHPGPVTVEPKDVTFSAELAALLKRSEFKQKKIVAVANDKLVAYNGDPVCIKKILEWENIKEGRKFNHIVMALCAYAVGKGWTLDDMEIKAKKIIETTQSAVYGSPRERLAHIKSIYRYFASSKEYHFSCLHMQKTVNVEHSDCPNCPLMAQIEAEDYDPSLGIMATNNCLYRRTETGRQQLTTFVIKPTSIIEFIDNNDSEYTMYAQLDSSTGKKAAVVFVQPDWGSKSAFLKKLPHPDFAYIGGDTDVQRIFHILSHVQVPKKIGVRTIGMHCVKGSWHFACSGGSLSGTDEVNELLLESDYHLPTKLLKTQPADVAELQRIIPALFSFNSVDIVMPLVGWFVSTFYKERIFAFTRQYPLLFIFGAAGSGKTQSILALKNLYALEGDNVKSIADVTNFTLIKSASANNTIPLMLDEYKSSTFSPFQVKMVSKLIRAAYNNEAGERGTASQKIIQYLYKSPIIIAGEQTVTEPAARDRIVEVHLSKAASMPHVEEFRCLQNLPLEKLGRLLLNDALKIPQEKLKALYEECFKDVPAAYLDRPRVNQAIVATGIKLLTELMRPYKLDGIIDTAWENYWKTKSLTLDEEVASSSKTDVDRILEAIGLMAEVDRYELTAGIDYKMENGKLFIYMRHIYQKYLKFAEEYKVEADTPNYTSFIKLIKKETYFLKDDIPVKLGPYQKLCMVLDLENLKFRKVNIISITHDLSKDLDQESDLKLP